MSEPQAREVRLVTSPLFFALQGEVTTKVGVETNIPGQVEQAVTPVLEREGFELVMVEYIPRGAVLRLFIDREGGVTIDDCVHVSQVLGDLLDAEGISERIPGRYHLEVSSPGLDRPLVKPRDFARFIGREVSLTTREPLEGGRRNFKGALAAALDRHVQLVIDGVTHDIPYDAIARAKLVPEL
jgi:ribosome maturation factor RimP